MPTLSKLSDRKVNDLIEAKQSGKWGEKHSKLKIKIQPTGKATWIFRHSGNERRIGTFPGISYRDALKQAGQYELELHAGSNPFAKQNAKLPSEQTTLAAAYKVYCKDQLPTFSTKHQRNVRAEFEKFILPKLGKRQVDDMPRADLLKMLYPHKTERPATHNRIISSLSSLYQWLSNHPDFAHYSDTVLLNPAKGFSRVTIKPRLRYPEPDECRQLWDACEGLSNPYIIALVRLLILTGQRPADALRAHHEHFDLEKGIWTIPYTKSEEIDFKLPMSNRAVQLIASLPRNEGRFVFSLNGGTKAIEVGDKIRNQLVKISGVTGRQYPRGKKWSYHDFRRSIKNTVENGGCLPFLSERMLGHKVKGIEKHYTSAQMLNEKHKWFTYWEEQVFDGR